jgi:hypothetical protein
MESWKFLKRTETRVSELNFIMTRIPYTCTYVPPVHTCTGTIGLRLCWDCTERIWYLVARLERQSIVRKTNLLGQVPGTTTRDMIDDKRSIRSSSEVFSRSSRQISLLPEVIIG